jgi:hypothetical protein
MRIDKVSKGNVSFDFLPAKWGTPQAPNHSSIMQTIGEANPIVPEQRRKTHYSPPESIHILKELSDLRGFHSCT